MKIIFKNIFIYFLLTVIFTTSFVGNSFALVDFPRETIYEVTGESGTQSFVSYMPPLNILPYLGDDAGGGDASVELTNPFCLAYAGLFAAIMYAGNKWVRWGATAAFLVAATAIYATASIKFEDYEICGANWLTYGNPDPNATSDIINFYPILGAYRGSRKYAVQQCLKTGNCIYEREEFNKNIKLKLNISGKTSGFNMSDKPFREMYYNGEEVENKNCIDPREERKNYDVGGDSQLYYMRGFAKGDYACDRFLVADKNDEATKESFKNAYNCCIEASKSVCITDKQKALNLTRDNERVKHFFCSKDEWLCAVDGIVFEIFKSEEAGDSYCARTWSLCPYNFNIERGTEKVMHFGKDIGTKPDENGNSVFNVEDECFDANNNKTLSCASQIKNFYQYRRHCTIVQEWFNSDDYEATDFAPFIDKSCINFVGSSHNTVEYKPYSGYDKLSFHGEYKTFTAPIVECITETLKNFLHNRAGHIRCIQGTKPDNFGNCEYGYEYREGDDLFEVFGEKDPLSKFLDRIDVLLKLTMTIMVMLYGYGLLIGDAKLDRKDMVMRLITITLVVTFCYSSWWRNQMVSFVYGFSSTLSEITSKMMIDDETDVNFELVKHDGCFFGNANDLFGGKVTSGLVKIEENNYYQYPSDRRYISIFDSLDCKIQKYLGNSMVGLNGGEARAIPNIIFTIAGGLIWPFNIGLYVGIASLLIALFVICFAIKAAYIFIASSIGLMLMMYFSPIAVPCVLFKSRKGMFDEWLKQTISYALQPMFLFAYISLSFSLMDKYVLGDAVFKGAGPQRQLICGYVCKDKDTGIIQKYSGGYGAGKYSTIECDENQEMVSLSENSFLCILEETSRVESFPVLSSIGILLYQLGSTGGENIITILRIAILFFLLNNVMTGISGIASNFSGGEKLPMGKAASLDPISLAMKIKDYAKTGQRIGKYAAKTGVGLVGKGVQKLKNNKKEKREAVDKLKKGTSEAKDESKGNDGDKGSGDDKKGQQSNETSVSMATGQKTETGDGK